MWHPVRFTEILCLGTSFWPAWPRCSCSRAVVWEGAAGGGLIPGCAPSNREVCSRNSSAPHSSWVQLRCEPKHTPDPARNTDCMTKQHISLTCTHTAAKWKKAKETRRHFSSFQAVQGEHMASLIYTGSNNPFKTVFQSIPNPFPASQPPFNTQPTSWEVCLLESVCVWFCACRVPSKFDLARVIHVTASCAGNILHPRGVCDLHVWFQHFWGSS